MKTKIVYVLVSSPQDIYYEQCLVSAWSLKKHNPKAVIYILTDQKTNETLTGKRKELNNIVNEIIVINTPPQYTPWQSSREIKTNIRKYIQGNLLFIDTDTVICESLSDIDFIESELAIVPDFHTLFKDYPFRGYILAEVKRLFNQNVSNVVNYFNSGVIYAKDTPLVHKFFEKWHNNWAYSALKKNNPKDQPALLKTDADVGQIISVLDGSYNCQIAASIRFLAKAKIIHFFNARFFHHNTFHPFYSQEFYLKVRNEGISPEVENMILNVRNLFNSYSTPISKPEFEFLSSPVGHIMMSIWEKQNWTWKVIQFLMKLYRKTCL